MADSDFDKFFDAVLETLKEIRKQKGLTQEDLGVRMGKPQSAVARLESGGVRDPRISMIFQVCEALEISPADALGSAFEKFSTVSKKSHIPSETQPFESASKAYAKMSKGQKAHFVAALNHMIELAK